MYSPSTRDDSLLSVEHRGRVRNNEHTAYQEVVFEPHQCGSKCVEEFPYQEQDYKSKLFIMFMKN